METNGHVNILYVCISRFSYTYQKKQNPSKESKQKIVNKIS